MIKPVALPKRSPIVSKALILAALLRREFSIQSNRSELGFFWVFAEPLSQVVMFGFLIGVLLKAKTVPDIPYPFFLVIGFQLIHVFKETLHSGMNAIGANRAYMTYQRIGTMDVLFAKMMFNFLSNLTATIIFIIAGIWWGIDVSLENLHVFLGAYIIIWLIGCGSGLSLTFITRRSMVGKRLIGMAMRPLMFVSCVLHPYADLPPYVAGYIYWNPIVHCVELARKSIFINYHTLDLNLAYPFIIAIVMMSLGTSIYYINRHDL